MPSPLISKEMQEFLQKKEFVSTGTCGENGKPNVAPKFLIKVEDDFVYLGDYVVGRTFQNLQTNPRVSISTVDLDALLGYQINGTAQILEQGTEYDALLKLVKEKELDLSVNRIIEGVQQGKTSQHFEVSFPERFIIFKIKVEEIAKIAPSGKVERKSL